jgi:tRNA(Ile)-lysidine synthase
MALLHLLVGMAESRELTLFAAHFDHALRASSAAEAERVRGWMDALGVPCRVGRAERALPPRQEAFRRARYAFLRRTGHEIEASRIATGHQADDQAETVLFRILRGTGIRGLAGIPERRGPIVRPLLRFRRRALETYLLEQDIDFLRDPSNRDPRWVRARLRAHVLPALEESWEAPVRERLISLAVAARRADRALEERAREALLRCRIPSGLAGGWAPDATAFDLRELLRLDRDTLARVVRRVARRAGVRLTRGGTRAAVEFISAGRSGAAVDLGGGLVATREFDIAWIGRPREAGPDTMLTIEEPAPGRGRLTVGGRLVQVTWGTGGRVRGSDAPVELALDRLQFPLLVRGWQRGDRIRTRAGTRKLKKLFGERRIPRSRRSRIPVVTSGDGRVLAVEALAVDPEAGPRADEERFVLRIEDA